MIFGIWLGPNEMPDLSQYCVSTWPDGSKMWWGRAALASKFTRLLEHPYFMKAHEAGHWAAASDLARLVLLYEFGGVYLDTDVEICNLDELKELASDGRAHIGFEDGNVMCNAVLIAPPKHPFIGSAIKLYDSIEFKDTYQGTVNGPTIITDLAKWWVDNKDGLWVHSPGSFYPWHYTERDINDDEKDRRILQQKSVVAHHWNASWVK